MGKLFQKVPVSIFWQYAVKYATIHIQFNSIESKGSVIHAEFHPQSLGLKMSHFKNGKKDTAHQSFNGKTSKWTTTDESYCITQHISCHLKVI